MTKKSLIVAVVGFAAGYLTNHYLQAPVANVQIVKSAQQECEQPQVLTETDKREIPLNHSATSLASEAIAAVPQKNPNAINDEADVPADQSQPQPEKIPAARMRMGASDVKPEDVITDAEIDAVIPAPFNNQLKGMHGYLRDKYKEFAATEQGGDWDVKMKGHIEDAIYSNPYGKDLIVESLNCKIGICELRLYETKNGAWSFILSEMGLQSWWDIGGSSSSGFGTQLNGKDITAYYVLMSKKGS